MGLISFGPSYRHLSLYSFIQYPCYTQVTVLKVRDTKMPEDNVKVNWESQAHIPRATSSFKNATGVQKPGRLFAKGR